MVVKRHGSGYAVKHCKSGKRGIIGKHKTKKAAMKQHRAIQVNKRK